MNIYEDDGSTVIVDLRKARDELASTGAIHDPAIRRERIAEISAAALLDIAESLRPVGAEASLALLGSGVFTTEEPGDDEPQTDDDRDFLVVGDLVVQAGDTEPGEVVKLGVSEGAVWADVDFADGRQAKIWQGALVRLRGDDAADPEIVEAIVEKVQTEIADATAPTEESIDETPDAADLVDDLDADFGDEPTPLADSALAQLEANEAARKAAKKSGKKGGTK